MKSIAIIPARGGSKRIPRKNIKEFLGKPIIAYSIEAALKSGVFDEVMVSTDDEEIAEIAKKYGASVPFMRSEKTANDYATMENVIEEVILNYKKMGHNFDIFCCLFSTAPFLSPHIIQNSYKIIKESGDSALIPVIQYSYPIQRALYIDNESHLRMREPEHIHTRSQDLQKMYHDAGIFYWMKIPEFLDSKEILCNSTGFMILPEESVQDIDTIEDWKIAETKYRLIKNENAD